MYTFWKMFTTPSAAINAARELSWSLQSSDLILFSGCDSPEDFEEILKSENWDDSWASANLVVGGDWYDFTYTTTTGKNSLRLVVGKGVACAFYTVRSRRSLKSSSAAQAFLADGWELSSELDADEQRQLEEEEDATTVANLRERLKESLLIMRFYISLLDTPFGPSVSAHSIHTNPKEDIRAITLCPSLAPATLAVAKKELTRSFVCPEQYEYNEEFHQGGPDGYYSRAWEEYRQGLLILKEFCEETISKQNFTEKTEQPK